MAEKKVSYDILTEFYIEAYKMKMFGDISIGDAEDGGNYYLTEKQKRALALLQDDTTLFVGYAGAARCFNPDTLVRTSTGYVKIKDVKIGDLVLSYNKSADKLEYKNVLNKYKYRISQKVVNINNQTLATYDHKVLFRGEWTKIGVLRKRILETDRRQLLHFGSWKIGNFKSSGFRQINADETCLRRERVSSYNDKSKWEIYNYKDAQGGVKSLCTEPTQQSNRKSQKPDKNGQQIGKSRMDEPTRKLPTRIGKRKTWQYLESWRKATSQLFETWFGQWMCKTDGRKSKGNPVEVQTPNLHKKDVGGRIWCFPLCNSGCDTEKLEARCITEQEIRESKIVDYEGYVYDLEVKDNHSYVITKDNLIVHNSGKTLLECFWLTFQCLAYPGVGYALCRKEISVLKKTALVTLFRMLDFYRLQDGVHYRFHDQKNKITFANGSEIFLIDTAYQPSDPLYSRFGGLELTGCAIDESNETEIDSIGTLLTRCGWRKNDDYKLPRKLYECFNPDRGHVYERYYKPYRDKNESEFRKFIPALPADNPHPSIKSWIEDVIKEGNKIRIQRLVYGNFDYDDNPDALCDYDAICDLFANDRVKETHEKYISADLAMQGRDKFIASYWKGNVCRIAIDKDKSSGKEIENDLKALIRNHGVYNSRVVADADGLGNYLESYIKNIKPFRGNKRAMNFKDYDNIKSECAWKLAEMINKREIRIICTPKQEEAIKQELAVCLKRDNLDSDDQKKKLVKKPQMKRELGRSPDYFDNLLMKMIFHLTRRDSKTFTVRAE